MTIILRTVIIFRRGAGILSAAAAWQDAGSTSALSPISALPHWGYDMDHGVHPKIDYHLGQREQNSSIRLFPSP